MPCETIWGSTRFGQEAERSKGKEARGKSTPEPLLGLTSMERQGRANSLGSVSLNSVSISWDIGVISSCLIPGPGDSGQGKYWLGVWELDKGSG